MVIAILAQIGRKLGMGFSREIQQTHDAIVRAGDGSKAEIITQGTYDPVTGVPTGSGTATEFYCVAVNYTREDIADPALANGLLKLLVTPLKPDGVLDENFESLIESKDNKVKLENGKEFFIRHSQITRPDSITPILARVFLGA